MMCEFFNFMFNGGQRMANFVDGVKSTGDWIEIITNV